MERLVSQTMIVVHHWSVTRDNQLVSNVLLKGFLVNPLHRIVVPMPIVIQI